MRLTPGNEAEVSVGDVIIITSSLLVRAAVLRKGERTAP